MRQYTATQLITCYRWCRDNPGGRVPIDRMTTLTAAEWVTWFRQCLDRKISSRMQGYESGRKWAQDWYWEAKRTADAVNTPRLIVRWVPKEFRSRLKHRTWTEA